MIMRYNEQQIGETESTQVSNKAPCAQCNHLNTFKVYTHLSTDDAVLFKKLANGLDQLNQFVCDHCQHQHTFSAPVCIHLPQEQRVIFAIPEHDRYRALTVQAEMLHLLSMRSHVVAQDYFTNPVITVGSSQLTHALDQKLPVQNSISVKVPNKPIAKAMTMPLTPAPNSTQDEFDQLLDVALSQAPTKISEIDLQAVNKIKSSQVVLPSSSSAKVKPPLFDAKSLTPPPTHSHKSLEQIPQALHQLEDRSQTQVNIITDVMIDDESPTQMLYNKNMRRFDESLAKGHTTYLKLNDDEIEVAAQVNERQAEGWVSLELDTRIQLHMFDEGAAPCLSLFTVVDEKIEDELCWPIEINTTIGPKILRLLKKNFRFELTLYKPNGNFYAQRLISAPLEENTNYLLNRIRKLKMNAKQASNALLKIRAEDFDHLGKMQHNFKQNSYESITNAHEAKLAIGIWSYWSSTQQRDYLLLVKSFPLPWLRRIQYRILSAGIEFGICMPPHLQSQAISLRLAKDDVDLLQKTVAHFVEVNIQLKASGLSAVDEWENWDALLLQVETLGIHIDEEVEGLAFQSMQNAGVDLEDDFYAEAERVDFDELEGDDLSISIPALGDESHYEHLSLSDMTSKSMLKQDDGFVQVSDTSIEFESFDEIGDTGIESIDISIEDMIEEDMIEEDMIEEEILEEEILEEDMIEEDMIEEDMIEEEILEEDMIEEEILAEEILEEDMIEEEILEEDMIEEEILAEEILAEEILAEEILEEVAELESDDMLEDHTTTEKDSLQNDEVALEKGEAQENKADGNLEDSDMEDVVDAIEEVVTEDILSTDEIMTGMTQKEIIKEDLIAHLELDIEPDTSVNTDAEVASTEAVEHDAQNNDIAEDDEDQVNIQDTTTEASS